MTNFVPGRDGRQAYSINEASAATGIGRDLIYKQINEGMLVARKVGRRTIITAAELHQFLKSLPEARSAA